MTQRIMRLLPMAVLVLLVSGGSAGTAQSSDPVLWDTVKRSPAPYSAADLAAKSGWREVADPGTIIGGDVCLANNRVALVLRRGQPEGEFYSLLDSQYVFVAALRPTGPGAERAGVIESGVVHERYEDMIVLDAVWGDREGGRFVVRCTLEPDRPFIETAAREGTGRVVVGCPARYTIVPDFFGNDLVVNARRIARSRLHVPSERLLVHLVNEGNTLVVCVWQSTDQDVRLALDGEGSNRRTVGTMIAYRQEPLEHVWLAAVSAPGIWHVKPIAELERTQGTPLAWQMPFEAEWRVDFRRQEDGLIDSWRPSTRKKDGNWEYCQGNGSHTAWSTARSHFIYPVHIESNAMYLVGTKFKDALKSTMFEGARHLTFDTNDVAIVYPFRRHDKGYGVRRVLRDALARTPDHRAYKQISPERTERVHYPATCGVTGRFEKIFGRGEEKEKRRDILASLREMNYFVVAIRERVEEYMAWMRGMETFCEARAGEPDIAGQVDRVRGMLKRMNRTYHEGRGERMLHPRDCQVLTEKVIALIDSSSGEDKTEIAQDLGRQIRSIGGAQDGVAGCMRQIVKELRQTAGIMVLEAESEPQRVFAAEVRQRTMEMLRVSSGSHEGE